MYEEPRHEPLINAPWNEARAREAIDRIVCDARARFDLRKLWPVHPLDQLAPGQTEPFKMLYFGAAGVVWALKYLERVGATEHEQDYAATLADLPRGNRAQLRLSKPNTFSYLMGDVGIQLVHWLLRPEKTLSDEIFAAVEANADHPARELMWGAPGTMLAALFMHELTGEPRWKEAYLRSAQHLMDSWEKNPALKCFVWTQDLYGQTSLYLGAVHGFAANVFALLKGRRFLGSRKTELIQRQAAQTLTRTAASDGAHANWPPALGGTRFLVQVCHGAPGMILCLADLPCGEDPDLDRLMVKGGELIWKAGPLAKGSNLCHGTAGNGYAFLKLYRRTGEERWLDRARAFAMHAITQSESHAARYEQLRYSLWTGDLGLAIYLWDCICGDAKFPTMDIF
jgi:lantibiotic modifying enzyme